MPTLIKNLQYTQSHNLPSFPSYLDTSLEPSADELTLHATINPQDGEILKYNKYGLSKLLAHTFLITGHIKKQVTVLKMSIADAQVPQLI